MSRQRNEYLNRIRRERDLETLYAALTHKDERVRRGAATRLGRLGQPEAVGVLAEALKDTSPDVQRAAVRSLGWLSAVEAVPDLQQLLSVENIDTRLAVITTLSWIKDDAVIAPLVEALQNDESALVQEMATGALAGLLPGATGEIVRLMARLEHADREPIARLLVQMHLASAPALVETLLNGDWETAWVAADLLMRIGKGTVPALAAALNEPDISAPAAMLITRVLAAFDTPEARGALKKAAGSPQLTVVEAVHSLRDDEAQAAGDPAISGRPDQPANKPGAVMEVVRILAEESEGQRVRYILEAGGKRYACEPTYAAAAETLTRVLREMEG